MHIQNYTKLAMLINNELHAEQPTAKNINKYTIKRHITHLGLLIHLFVDGIFA